MNCATLNDMFKNIINDKVALLLCKVFKNIRFYPFLTLFKVIIYLFGDAFELLVRQF